MKKRTILGIFLSMICILLLIGLGIFLMIDAKKMSSTAIETTDITALFSELTTEAAAETATENKITDEETILVEDVQTAAALAAAKAAAADLPEHHLIFVGDSRTVGMGDAETVIGDECVYIGAVGEGYYWFEETGMAQMEEAMAQYPDSPVILNLGVNDPDSIEQYLELYQTFPARYPEHVIYFMAVNPVTDEAKNITNMEISSFNSRLRAAFPEQYLDSNTYLLIREFESADGVHYSNDTYRVIHDYAVRQIIK